MIKAESPACAVPCVDILEAHDVVFAQVATGLDLDDLQGNGPGVLQPVVAAHRDVGRLVLGDQECPIVAGHAGGAGDHDPVLGPMVVHLQRQGFTRLHAQTFDLIAPAATDGLVGPPGAMHLLVVAELLTLK